MVDSFHPDKLPSELFVSDSQRLQRDVNILQCVELLSRGYVSTFLLWSPLVLSQRDVEYEGENSNTSPVTA